MDSNGEHFVRNYISCVFFLRRSVVSSVPHLDQSRYARTGTKITAQSTFASSLQVTLRDMEIAKISKHAGLRSL